jgi:hypothetical protein
MAARSHSMSSICPISVLNYRISHAHPIRTFIQVNFVKSFGFRDIHVVQTGYLNNRETLLAGNYPSHWQNTIIYNILKRKGEKNITVSCYKLVLSLHISLVDALSAFVLVAVEARVGD